MLVGNIHGHLIKYKQTSLSLSATPMLKGTKVTSTYQ